MRKSILVTVLFVSLLSAQGGAGNLCFQQGTNTIGVGGNITWGNGMGVSVAWDRGAINNMFSFGAEINSSFDFEKSDYVSGNYKSQEKWVTTSISPQFRFAFHPFGIPAIDGKVEVASQLDPYVVAHIGPRLWWSKWEWDDENGVHRESSDNGVKFDSFGIATGVRWMFKPNLGLWGEIDWDRFIVGVAFKF